MRLNIFKVDSFFTKISFLIKIRSSSEIQWHSFFTNKSTVSSMIEAFSRHLLYNFFLSNCWASIISENSARSWNFSNFRRLSSIEWREKIVHQVVFRSFQSLNSLQIHWWIFQWFYTPRQFVAFSRRKVDVETF